MRAKRCPLLTGRQMSPRTMSAIPSWRLKNLHRQHRATPTDSSASSRGAAAKVPTDIDGVQDFESAWDAMAAWVKQQQVPMQGLKILLACRMGEDGFSELPIGQGTELAKALDGHLCPQCEVNFPRASICEMCRGSFKVRCSRCSGSGRFSKTCRGCDGTGRGRTKPACPVCGGLGLKDLGACNACHGSKMT